MKLFFNLRHGATSGNCGGDLRLFFTTQNSSDWKPTPAPGMWLPVDNTPQTLTLPTGDSIVFALYPVVGLPGQLYLFGAITVHTGGQTLNPGPIGQSTVPIVPNQQALTFWKGHGQGNANGIVWDVGFDMTVPWDGTSADCHGQWWALWGKSGS
jgi:hypothetical protein